MSWALNQGPSFNNILQPTQKLNGFYQRFQLRQDDNRMTPGKREKVTKAASSGKANQANGLYTVIVSQRASHSRFTAASPIPRTR